MFRTDAFVVRRFPAPGTRHPTPYFWSFFKGEEIMFRSRCRAFHLALIPILFTPTLTPAHADEHHKDEKTSGSTILHPYRLPISRMGYSNAKPDKATVEVPTLV